MSYTPTTTFVSGNVIAAADLQGNIDGMQSYANGGVVPGDLLASTWCEQQHVVAPEYNATTATLQAVSGSTSEAERPTFTGRYSYAQRATSNQGVGVTVWQWVPGTVQQFVVPRSARAILLQFGCAGTTGGYENADVAGGIAGFGQPVTKLRAFLTSMDLQDISDLNGLGDLSMFTEHQVQIEAPANVSTQNKSFSKQARRDHYSGLSFRRTLVLASTPWVWRRRAQTPSSECGGGTSSQKHGWSDGTQPLRQAHRSGGSVWSCHWSRCRDNDSARDWHRSWCRPWGPWWWLHGAARRR